MRRATELRLNRHVRAKRAEIESLGSDKSYFLSLSFFAGCGNNNERKHICVTPDDEKDALQRFRKQKVGKSAPTICRTEIINGN